MVLQEKFPQSEHRFCVQHIYNNFKKRFIGESMKQKIWEISTCTTIEEFEQRMEAMSVWSPQAHQYLVNVAPREKWVMAFYSSHIRCDTQVISCAKMLISNALFYSINVFVYFNHRLITCARPSTPKR